MLRNSCNRMYLLARLYLNRYLMTDSPAARRGALAARALQHVLRRECDRHDAGGANQSNGGRSRDQVPAPAARGAAGGVGEPPGLGAAAAGPGQVTDPGAAVKKPGGQGGAPRQTVM
jgi:hypothetical protein